MPFGSFNHIRLFFVFAFWFFTCFCVQKTKEMQERNWRKNEVKFRLTLKSVTKSLEQETVTIQKIKRKKTCKIARKVRLKTNLHKQTPGEWLSLIYTNEVFINRESEVILIRYKLLFWQCLFVSWQCWSSNRDLLLGIFSPRVSLKSSGVDQNQSEMTKHKLKITSQEMNIKTFFLYNWFVVWISSSISVGIYLKLLFSKPILSWNSFTIQISSSVSARFPGEFVTRRKENRFRNSKSPNTTSVFF